MTVKYNNPHFLRSFLKDYRMQQTHTRILTPLPNMVGSRCLLRLGLGSNANSPRFLFLPDLPFSVWLGGPVPFHQEAARSGKKRRDSWLCICFQKYSRQLHNKQTKSPESAWVDICKVAFSPSATTVYGKKY